MDLKHRLLYSRANRRLIGWAQRVVLPGFEGFSLYHIFRFFILALVKGNLVTRAAAIAFRMFLSFFPAIVVLIALIPFVPVPDFQAKLLDAFRSMLPAEVYHFIEGLLQDLLMRKNSTLLSVSFVLGLYFASNSVNAILHGFRSSHFITSWYKPFRQRLVSLLLMLILTVLCVLATALLTVTSWGASLIHHSGHILSSVETIGLYTVKWATSVLVILCAIALLYRAGMPGKERFRLVTPGAVLALVLVMVLSQALAFVFKNITNYNALYGSIGAILAVQLWLYFNMIVLLVGFELNTSIAKARKEHRHSLRPVDVV